MEKVYIRYQNCTLVVFKVIWVQDIEIFRMYGNVIINIYIQIIHITVSHCEQEILI